MRAVLRRWVFGALALALALLAGEKSTDAKLVARIDHFLVLLDQSGSMYMHHGTLGKTRMVLAKQLLGELNAMLPEWGYGGALCLVAPFRQLQKDSPFVQGRFADALGKVRDNQEIFGRTGSLGLAFRDADPVLDTMKGPTAVIFISDGDINGGPDPAVVVMNARLAHLNIRIHTISLADDPAGRNRMAEIAQAGNGIAVEAAQLLADSSALQEFVNEVFFEEVPERAPDPTLTVVPGVRAIYFDPGKSEIKPEWAAVLDEDASVLKSRPGSILIEGHSDNARSDEESQRISERRARVVKEYLIGRQIPGDRIKTIGYGMLRPVGDNDTEKGRAANRRVDIKVVQ